MRAPNLYLEPPAGPLRGCTPERLRLVRRVKSLVIAGYIVYGHPVFLRRLLLDIGPLKSSPPFRRLWAGSGLSGLGSQMTNYAVLLQVFLLTHSSFDVGLVGLFIAVPAITVALLGGALVDAVDRRKTVLLATSTQVCVSSLLAFQAFADLRLLWLLYGLVALQAVVSGVNAPARRTFMPNLLGPEQLAAGAALQMSAGYVSMMAGPALAGLITEVFGLKVCYLADATSFGFALYGVARLPAMRPGDGAGTSARGFTAIGEGFRFIFHQRLVLGALAADMSAMFLGMPIALFPAINAQRFGGRPETLGLLTTAVAVGGVFGSVFSGPVSRVSRQGLGMLVGGSVWGAALVGFGLAYVFWLALVTLAVAGAADVTSVVLRVALVQGATPDRLRGRVSAAEHAVGSGVPQLGNFEAGAVASATSATTSVVIGGAASIAGAILVGLAVPALVRARALTGPPGRPMGVPTAPAPEMGNNATVSSVGPAAEGADAAGGRP